MNLNYKNVLYLIDVQKHFYNSNLTTVVNKFWLPTTNNKWLNIRLPFILWQLGNQLKNPTGQAHQSDFLVFLGNLATKNKKNIIFLK